MKQSSLDLAYNLCINVIYESNIETVDKLELLKDLRFAYISYEAEKEEIKTIDFRKVK